MLQKLKYKVGQKVNCRLDNSVIYTGIITDAVITRSKKPYTIVSDEGKEFYANEQYLEPINIVMYKGYYINLAAKSHCALIYQNTTLVKCIAGNIFYNGANNRLSKAKKHIDTL